MQSANINARTQEAVADKYTAMSQIVAEINKAATLGSAGIHAGATRYAADQAAAASRYGADAAQLASIFASINSSSASRYATDVANTYKETYGPSEKTWLAGKGLGLYEDYAGESLFDTLAGLFSGSNYGGGAGRGDRK